MKIRPLGNKVLLKRAEAKDKTEGGILLPDVAKDKSQRAKVLAVGPGATMKDGTIAPMQVKVGNTVLIGKWAGSEVQGPEGEELLITSETEILAVVD
jgi:chaperonin GroES